MPTKDQYDANARKAVRELFPSLSPEGVEALAFLIADFLMSLDAIAAGAASIER